VSVVSVFGIAVGLAMDAFAVSVASGAVIKRRRLHNAARFGLFFGGFQMAMPVIGWVLE
jgi:putative Mn2+ efflux pump MntP